MKTEKRVTYMTERELREYRRELKKRMIRRRRAFVGIVTLLLITILTFSVHAFTSNASTGDEEIKFRYYTRVEVMPGETLWEIAQDYMDEEMYSSTAKYVSDVKRINHLNYAGDIKAGQILVLPYYSTEYVY